MRHMPGGLGFTVRIGLVSVKVRNCVFTARVGIEIGINVKFKVVVRVMVWG